MSKKIEELTRLTREINGRLHNGLDDIKGEIEEVVGEHASVVEACDEAETAFYKLQQALDDIAGQRLN